MSTDVLFGIAAPPERSFRSKIVGLIGLQKMGINIIVIPIVSSTGTLAGARCNDLGLLPMLVATFFTCGLVQVLSKDGHFEKILSARASFYGHM